jgi:nitrous-oxide reductase
MSRVRYGAAALSLVGLAACGSVKPEAPGTRQMATGEVQDAALATFVKPGDQDEYYLFYSGGHSGQVFVAGVPSMRHIFTIPVFAAYPGTGYGFDEETRAMLGGYTWGDVHHPAASKTDGDYDGRWLFVNDNANNRIARIDLRDLKTKQILGPIPNTMGNHGSSMVTDGTEYALVATRFSVPMGTEYAPLEEYATRYKGAVTGIKVDQKSGEMSVGWQIMTPPFNWDLGATGKGPSVDWAFWTSYNTERATGKLEASSTQRDKDYVAVVNWRAAEKATAEGKATEITGVKVLDPAKVEGIMYLLPCGKSPHGVDVDPSGEYVVCSGKLQPTSTVYSFAKIQDAIAKQSFSGEEDGIPVIRYEDALVMEIPVGLGPLHTQFDGKGYAYTSLYVESAIAKWKLPPYEAGVDPKSLVVDKIPVQFNVGHLVTAHGDTRHPKGDWLVAMNKMSKGRSIKTGPSIPESSQLIDITGRGGAKMKMVYEAYTEPEPHFAQLVHKDVLKNTIEFYPKAENHHPKAIWAAAEAKVTRNAATRTVEGTVFAVRSYFEPGRIQVQEGDTVVLHITNAEQARDEIHGFGLVAFDKNVVIDPGETKTLKFVARKSGVYPYYCTNFCSALHQEMQGYLEVVPQGRPMALYENGQGLMKNPLARAGGPVAPAPAHAHEGRAKPGAQQVAAH